MWAKAASRISVKAAFTIVLRARQSFRAMWERGWQLGGLCHSRTPQHHPCCHPVCASVATLPQPRDAGQGAAHGRAVPAAILPAGGETEGMGCWDPQQGLAPTPLVPTPCGTPWPEYVCTHRRTAPRTPAFLSKAPVSPRDCASGPASRVPLGLWSPRSRQTGSAAGTGCSPAPSVTDGWLPGQGDLLLPQDTGTGPRGVPSPLLPPRDPHTACTPHRHAFAPDAAQRKRLSLPPQGNQKPLPALYP